MDGGVFLKKQGRRKPSAIEVLHMEVAHPPGATCIHHHLEIIGLQLPSVQDCPKPQGLQQALGTPKSGGTDPAAVCTQGRREEMQALSLQGGGSSVRGSPAASETGPASKQGLNPS